MTRKRIGVLAGVAVLAAEGLGVGVAVAASGPGGRPAAAGTTAGPGYSWYQSTMSRYYGGPMMGGSSGGWMTGRQGYQWMMGRTSVPGWMRGGRLPGSMMTGGTADPGQIMGQLWAGALGPRVSAPQAIRLESQVPAGARTNRAANTVTFAASTVHLVAVASPDETFRVAGLANPAITVPAEGRSTWERSPAACTNLRALSVLAETLAGQLVQPGHPGHPPGSRAVASTRPAASITSTS